MTNCYICGCSDAQQEPQGLQTYFWCSFCGGFTLAQHMNHNFYNLEKYCTDNSNFEVFPKRHILAGWMLEFNRNRPNPLPFNGIDDFMDILNDSRMPKTAMQRLDRLLLNLYKFNDSFGAIFAAPQMQTGNKLRLTHGNIELPYAIAYATDFNETRSMLFSLEMLGYMALEGTKDKGRFFITPKGYERVESLLHSNTDSKSVFVAMQYDNSHIQEAFENAIKPACGDCGFDALIIKDKHHNNGITDEIIVEIKKSKFVVVDFTFGNNGAYWEAGYAQGLGRTVIRSCKKEWFDKHGLHFDIKHYRTIIWESPSQLAQELKDNIRANFSDAKMEDGDGR
ncbi:MAG: hypothetical protein FWC92_07225 [Defluviitaleaceae bacterium]|nr:hypothetical protein [Defluviitaleaceae bacterium]